MNIHNIYRIFSSLLVALIFSLLLGSAAASDEHDHAPVSNFQEGTHYHRISPTVETDVEDGKVEVLELLLHRILEDSRVSSLLWSQRRMRERVLHCLVSRKALSVFSNNGERAVRDRARPARSAQRASDYLIGVIGMIGKPKSRVRGDQRVLERTRV